MSSAPQKKSAWGPKATDKAADEFGAIFNRTNSDGTPRYKREEVLQVATWVLTTIYGCHPSVTESGDTKLFAELMDRAGVKPGADSKAAGAALRAFAAKYPVSKELTDEVMELLRSRTENAR